MPERHCFHTEVIKMAVEPMGSIMSIQAQSVTAPTRENTVPAMESSNMTVGPVEQVEKTAKVADNAQGKAQGDMASKQGQDPGNNEQIRKAVENLNKNMVHSEAIFGIHEETNRVTIKIIDKETKETIKELPPEKTLNMIAKVWELAGILVDEKR